MLRTLSGLFLTLTFCLLHLAGVEPFQIIAMIPSLGIRPR